jgi:hypothetical protein
MVFAICRVVLWPTFVARSVAIRKSKEEMMKTIFAIATAMMTGIIPVRAANYSDMAQFAQAICGDIPEGNLSRTSIQGKIGANAGVLAKLISGDASVSAAKTEELYKGIPFDKLPEKIPTVSMCKVELVKLLLSQEHGSVIQQTNGTNSPAQNGNGNTVNINGNK